MIFDIFTDGFSIRTVIFLAVRLMIILFFLPVHEFAHGYVACKLGDPTAKNMGRLTLNPIAHIDLWGLLLSIFAGVGFAKAVPVNMMNFRPEKRKRNMAIVAVAGPLSNIILASIFILVSYIVRIIGYSSNPDFIENFKSVCEFAAECNAMLAVFNLLPVPPLDGSRILNVVLPDSAYYKVMQYERQIGLVFIVLVITGALDGFLSLFSGLLLNLLNKIISLPFGLFW